MPPTAPPLDFRDFWRIAPAATLALWGLVVVLTDLGLARRLGLEARRRVVGRLALAGVGLALISAVALFWLDSLAAVDPERLRQLLGASLGDYFARSGEVIFLGALASGVSVDILNFLYLILLALVIQLATSYRFTDDWGECLALLIWATVGMMFLSAAEELATLFLSLEMMTICLYLLTAFEKSRRRSVEAGLKYFIYGSVSSALFLYGLSLVYGLAGTTRFDAIERILAGTSTTAPGLVGNLAGASALLLMLVGFGFKIAAVPFHQWAPDAYEGAPAPVAAWIVTGSKIASIVALMKVFLHAARPWSFPSNDMMGPGWVGIIAVVSAVTMTYGNLAALVQTNFKRMLAYSSIAHGGYILVGLAAAAVSINGPAAAGALLYYLVIYAFSNLGAFAVAAWLVRDRSADEIDDLNGMGAERPLLALCLAFLMLSLIGVPPFGGFFGKLYVFMEALNQGPSQTRIILVWLVALGLLNSAISAFYYVRVLKAMYFRPRSGAGLKPAKSAIATPVLLSTLVVVVFGLFPQPLVDLMKSAAGPMLVSSSADAPISAPPAVSTAPGAAAR